MNSGDRNCSHEKAWGQGHPDRSDESRALKIALLITVLFLLAELAGGWWTNSLALIADAGHMFTDAAALALSLFAVWFISKPATPEKTYGYFRVEILAALANGSALILIALGILWEAYHRFLEPEEVKSLPMLGIAILGLGANLICARILHSHHDHNLNIRGAFLHVLGDILGSLAAIAAGLMMWLGEWYWADPLVSSIVGLLICYSAWRLVSDAVRVLLEGAPSHLSVTAMKQELSRVPGVASIHDLHVWTLTSGVHAMTCHAVVESADHREVLQQLQTVSKERFDVHHTTIQLEEEDLCRELETICH